MGFLSEEITEITTTIIIIRGDRNMIKEEAVKISKYKDLLTEIQLVGNVKTKVIPVITGATGTISNHSDSTRATYRESTKLMNHKNSHIVYRTHTAESANVKVQHIFHGRNNITCSTNCKYRTAATLYTLETWFVAGLLL